MPLESVPNVENIAYLKAKAAKLGHHLVFDTDVGDVPLPAPAQGNGGALPAPSDARERTTEGS